VESALVLIVFMVMLIGVFDVAQMLYVHTSITERIRGALRWAVVNTYDETAIRNYVLYGQTTAPQNGSTLFSMTTSMVDVQRVGEGTTDDRIVITVSNFKYTLLSPFVSGVKTGASIVEGLPYEAKTTM